MQLLNRQCGYHVLCLMATNSNAFALGENESRCIRRMMPRQSVSSSEIILLRRSIFFFPLVQWFHAMYSSWSVCIQGIFRCFLEGELASTDLLLFVLSLLVLYEIPPQIPNPRTEI